MIINLKFIMLVILNDDYKEIDLCNCYYVIRNEKVI